MSDRPLNLDKLEALAKGEPTLGPWPEVVLALIAEMRVLRKDQDNWFVYLRWRASQDEKPEE